MATKTFKIGLSNTDKQNMAQDVYERVLALTFAEYDSANTYNEGDFVVYDDTLYQCKEDNVTGTWDSSKWEQATLQDLLNDVEGAVASVNDKANVDGNYPTMTVGVADQLSPYDENSGDDQDEPFSFQATGTGNGTQPDFATGSIALMKEKQGNSVVVNQYCDRTTDLVGTAGASIYTSLGTAFVQNPIPVGHKVLIFYKQNTTITEATRNTVGLRINTGENTYDYQWINQSQNRNLAAGNYYELVTTTYPVVNFAYWVQGYGDGDISFSDFKGIDLTQWFNGDIPQDLLDNPSNFFRYYQGSLAYNEGTLVNANGRYIKCIGINQWDEEWELGSFDSYGDKNTNYSWSRNKNSIKVIPGAVYYSKRPGIDGSPLIWCYDVNNNFIGTIYYPRNDTFTVPSNCAYINIAWTGTTYNNDISINLYYEDEERCLTYEPYQVLTNNDTGTEVLRSAGSVKDSKAPDGTITRRVGYAVVDGTNVKVDYKSGSTDNYLYKINISPDLIKLTTSNYQLGNIVCDKLTNETFNDLRNNNIKGIAIHTADGIYIGFTLDSNFDTIEKVNTWLANNNLTIFYELAEPTTEQGTPYSENLVIDDFGSMDFDSDVPQGALIFYPVDYKAFVDTLYNYTEGTPSNLAKKTDLPTAPQTWAESLPGYDATKTQVLKNVEGTLTWVTEE